MNVIIDIFAGIGVVATLFYAICFVYYFRQAGREIRLKQAELRRQQAELWFDAQWSEHER